MFKLIISILLFCSSFVGFGADFVLGKDYELINESTSAGKQNTTTVTEFFSYACPWCYRIEPALQNWLTQQGSSIQFEKVPVVFSKDWEYYAKAYYLAKALSLNTKLDPILFKAIIQDKLSLHSNQTMIDFLVKAGVDKKIAESAFENSPSIEMNIETGKELMAHYHINAVPAFVINKHYKTDLQMAKTEQHLFEIITYLIKQRP